MIVFYPHIKDAHLLAVATSGALFALRGVAVLAGARWPMQGWLRWTSYAIDTVLLTAAMMLVVVLPAPVFANHWLAVKLGLVLAYIVAGSLALKRARGRAARAAWYVLALALFGGAALVARAHHPLGPFAG